MSNRSWSDRFGKFNWGAFVNKTKNMKGADLIWAQLFPNRQEKLNNVFHIAKKSRLSLRNEAYATAHVRDLLPQSNLWYEVIHSFVSNMETK